MDHSFHSTCTPAKKTGNGWIVIPKTTNYGTNINLGDQSKVKNDIKLNKLAPYLSPHDQIPTSPYSGGNMNPTDGGGGGGDDVQIPQTFLCTITESKDKKNGVEDQEFSGTQTGIPGHGDKVHMDTFQCPKGATCHVKHHHSCKNPGFTSFRSILNFQLLSEIINEEEENSVEIPIPDNLATHDKGTVQEIASKSPDFFSQLFLKAKAFFNETCDNIVDWVENDQHDDLKGLEIEIALLKGICLVFIYKKKEPPKK